MRSIKTFGLAAVAAVALMALAAGSASATALYNGTTKLGAGATLDFSIPLGNSVALVTTNNETLDTCTTSTLKGKLSSPATASFEELTWGNCTFPTKTTLPGKLEFISTGGTEGSVKVDSEFKVSINTVLFGECVYGDNVGSIFSSIIKGIITGLGVNWVLNKLSGSNPPCPATVKWTGFYVATQPSELRVEAE